MNDGAGEFQNAGRGWKHAGLLILLLIVALFGLFWFTWSNREPSYHGQPLSFWLSKAEDLGAGIYDHNNPTNIECRLAIRSIGTKAIPVLIRILRAKDSSLKTKVMELADRQDYLKVPLRSVEEQKRKAGLGFYFLGDLGTNAVSALIDIYQHPASYSSEGVAQTALMWLYPDKSVLVPHWLPPEKRAQWYIDTGTQAQWAAPSNALLAFFAAVQIEPTNVIIWPLLGNTRLQLQDPKGALVDFEKGIALAPSNAPAISGRGVCKLLQKDLLGAEADFTRALDIESNDLRTLNYRGMVRANLRELDGALADFNRAIELSPYEASFFRNRGMVETMQTEFESAMSDFSKALELDSKDSLTWALRSRIHSILKDYGAALADANKAIQINPTNSSAYSARGSVHMSLDRFESALADADTALRLNPKDPGVFLLRGVVKAKRGNEDEGALADFERAVELAPQHPETHGMLGLFQYKTSNWNQARENLRKALQLGAIANVSDYNAYIWLIRAQSGEEQDANKELKTFLNSLDDSKTNEWKAHTARFLSGSLSESNFLKIAATVARRPSAISNQVCDSFYFAAMKRKIAGDKAGAVELLHKCLDTKLDNNFAYLNAVVEVRTLKPENSVQPRKDTGGD